MSCVKAFILVVVSVISAAVSAQSLHAYQDTAFTNYFRRTSGWTASDATISVPLPSGKTLWLMGDSHIDNYNAADTTLPCLFQVRNSILVQDILAPAADFVTVLDYTKTGIERTPIKLPNNNSSYFWPGHGYAKRDTAIVFWQQYSGANFSHVANYISKIYTPGLQSASSIKVLKERSLPASLEFGTSVVVDSTANYIYLYGFKKDWIIFRPLVARFPLTQDVFGPWEFYANNGWTSDPNASQQLMANTNDYVSPSFSVLKLQGKYYMISQDIGFLTCGLGREIYSWESNSPEGPFTNKKLLYTIEDKYRGEYMITYNATAHPEFIKNNELLISYNVNGACTKYCEPYTNRFHADLYRPKFIRVRLDYIDPLLNVPDPIYPIDTPITGIVNDQPVNDRINIYPNPSSTGMFTISYEGELLAPVQVELLSAHGTILFSETLINANTRVVLTAPGIYFLRSSIDGLRTTTRKIIVL